MSTPTASWDLPVLLGSLRRAGARILPKGELNVLEALAALLPHGSAAGHSTYVDIAARAGLHPDTTRKLLNKLEQRGLLRWTRGYAVLGAGRPGFFRVSKTAIVALINAARKAPDRDTARRTATEKTRSEHYRTNRLILRTKPRPQRALPDILSPLHIGGDRRGSGLSPARKPQPERTPMSEKLAQIVPLFGQRDLVHAHEDSSNKASKPAAMKAYASLSRLNHNAVQPPLGEGQLDSRLCGICARDERGHNALQRVHGNDHDYEPMGGRNLR